MFMHIHFHISQRSPKPTRAPRPAPPPPCSRRSPEPAEALRHPALGRRSPETSTPQPEEPRAGLILRHLRHLPGGVPNQPKPRASLPRVPGQLQPPLPKSMPLSSPEEAFAMPSAGSGAAHTVASNLHGHDKLKTPLPPHPKTLHLGVQRP